MVYLPSLEMCRITLEPCRILYNTSFFPEFLKCNETLFPPKCNNEVREMKFNATGQCMAPLVLADSTNNYYEDIEGCGVQCKDPLYTDDEHRQIQKLIGWCGLICMLCNGFVIATFAIDWQNANKCPAVIVFYINFCFLICCLGWLIQFTPGSREDVTCRKDGTLRHSEPSAGENLSCIVVFVMVYYFLIAAMVWFVILTYAVHIRAIGNVQDRIDKKGSYFHLVAWSLPLILTITTMALSEVDANSVNGICFVGYLNHSIRAGLLLGPIGGVLLIGGFFMFRGIIMLFNLKTGIKSKPASSKLHLIIIRMVMCAMFICVFILVTIFCHINEFRTSHLWAESLRKFIICKIMAAYTDSQASCKIENRPSVALLQLHLLCLFASGILMSSWCWTSSSVETWRRYLKKAWGKEVAEEIKIPKHKVIAYTWAKRKEFQDRGRLSITFYNTHTDPVGLNFDVNDLNSTGTNEISSTWANYLPQFVKRRFALTGFALAGMANNSASCGPRKSSVDSEISVSVRHVSVESRRNSVDSQLSVKIAEMKTKVARSHHRSSKTGKARSRGKDFFSAGRRYSRRESSTSVESQIIAAMKKTSYTSGKDKSMKRRSASAGLVDADQISNLIANGNLILPFLQNQGMTTTSDDEVASRTSLKIRDSRFDMVVRRGHSDDDDDSRDNSADNRTNGIHIEELHSEDDSKYVVSNALVKAGQKGMGSSLKSNRSRKSSRQSSRRTAKAKIKPMKREVAVSTMSGGDDSSFTSFHSELDLAGVQSSYSGISACKTNSRNSKRSCDVGIQANAFEIATQTMSSFDDLDLKSSSRNNFVDTNKLNEDNEDSCTESHTLLPVKRKEAVIMGRRDTSAMTESEKLKLLLLPSNSAR